MKHLTIVSLLIFTCMFFKAASYAQIKSKNNMQWEIITELPAKGGLQKSLGLAGPVAGVSNDVLIVAGGANFPDSMPWLGGKKKYYKDVYVLQKGSGNKFSWIDDTSLHLKQNLAYSGNITTEEGIVCVGGETDTGHTSEVFLLNWDNLKKEIHIKDLPALPIELANMAIANIGKTIYVAGGEDGQNASNAVFKLDMSAVSPQWTSLPDLPIVMSHSVAVAQSNGEYQCIYVIGGRTKSASGISDLHNTVFCYDPKKNNWKQLSNISDGKKTTNRSAATAVALGETCILLIGGDNGTVFQQIETYNLKIAGAKSEIEKQNLQAEKFKLLNNHPGFSRDVLVYNTTGDCWSKIGELPGFGPVTTTALKWREEIFIPSGEIKPGRRTPEVLRGKVKK